MGLMSRSAAAELLLARADVLLSRALPSLLTRAVERVDVLLSKAPELLSKALARVGVLLSAHEFAPVVAIAAAIGGMALAQDGRDTTGGGRMLDVTLDASVPDEDDASDELWQCDMEWLGKQLDDAEAPTGEQGAMLALSSRGRSSWGMGRLEGRRRSSCKAAPRDASTGRPAHSPQAGLRIAASDRSVVALFCGATGASPSAGRAAAARAENSSPRTINSPRKHPASPPGSPPQQRLLTMLPSPPATPPKAKKKRRSTSSVSETHSSPRTPPTRLTPPTHLPPPVALASSKSAAPRYNDMYNESPPRSLHAEFERAAAAMADDDDRGHEEARESPAFLRDQNHRSLSVLSEQLAVSLEF